MSTNFSRLIYYLSGALMPSFLHEKVTALLRKLKMDFTLHTSLKREWC